MADNQKRVPIARRLTAENSISLAKRRIWYADDPAKEGASSAGTQNTDNLPRTVPYDRFQEVNEARKRAEAELDRLRTETQEAARKALEKQGEYKELWEKTVAELELEKQHRERAKLLSDTVEATNKKRIERIPEEMRTIIPSEYTPDKLSAWLDANEAKLTKPLAPSLDGGKTGESVRPTTVHLTELEQHMAKVANMKPEDYAKFKEMAGTPPEIGKPLDK